MIGSQVLSLLIQELQVSEQNDMRLLTIRQYLINGLSEVKVEFVIVSALNQLYGGRVPAARRAMDTHSRHLRDVSI